ncbi:MAG: lipid-A-disaccharide synthase [Mesonia hippocampi]|uniref:lipid-A-disaccharide synthase n=1 Tax=Mesonia hippocampi TaxID=1628250 RepID=UPI003F986C12
MKYYLIAGEASGDLHGANLMKALKKTDAHADFRFWGGDLMQQVGGTLVKHYHDLAFMGFVEVLANLRTIFKNISLCKKDIEAYKPDVIIFIDYPGFNFRIAKWAKQQGYKTHYYISPQIWAWKENRIKSIKRDIDEMYVILPFEKDFYEKKHHFPVHFVGHPLLDAISNRTHISFANFIEKYKLPNKPIIAILPGSRKQEITKMLNTMLLVTRHFPSYQFIIAGAPSQQREFYTPFLEKNQIHLVMNDTYDLLEVATAAMVTSGTATLETALFDVPEVVCYKGSYISYHIAKRIIKLNYISLVNLIMDKEVVKELIQNDFNEKNLTNELQKLLNPEHRNALLQEYKLLKNKLGGVGASTHTAELIYKNLNA